MTNSLQEWSFTLTGRELNTGKDFKQKPAEHLGKCLSSCERCFVYADIQLSRIPRELGSLYSCCCCEQTNPTGQVWSQRNVLSPSNQAYERLQWIIRVILTISFLARCKQLHVTVAWWFVPNHSLVGYFPRENHEELLSPDKPSLQERSSTHSRRNELGNTSGTWIYRSPWDQMGCILQGWLTPFQGFLHLSEKLLL